MMNKRAEIICKYFGHQWVVTDYSNSMKANGDSYKYSKKRECTRCHKHEYLFNEWIQEINVIDKDKDEGFSEFNKMENKNKQ